MTVSGTWDVVAKVKNAERMDDRFPIEEMPYQ